MAGKFTKQAMLYLRWYISVSGIWWLTFLIKYETPHKFISQWEETYKYRIWYEASQAWLQYCEAVFSKPESSFYLLSNNVRVYNLYCAKIENRLVWEALELRLITWEDSYCPFISHSPSQDCQGECKPDQCISLKGDYCKASALSIKTRENGRESMYVLSNLRFAYLK